jgi:hypothetical protein
MEKDFVQAYRWFSLSESLLPSTALQRKQRAIKARNATASELTPEQLVKAKELVRAWERTQEKGGGQLKLRSPTPLETMLGHLTSNDVDRLMLIMGAHV